MQGISLIAVSGIVMLGVGALYIRDMDLAGKCLIALSAIATPFVQRALGGKDAGN